MVFILKAEKDIQAVCNYLQTIKVSHKPYRVTIEVEKSKRTKDQNRLYWMWLSCISEESGNSRDDLHEFFKQKFLNTYARVIYGEEVKCVQSTTELQTDEFTKYLENIQLWVAEELGITLPNPDDLIYSIFEDKYKGYY